MKTIDELRKEFERNKKVRMLLSERAIYWSDRDNNYRGRDEAVMGWAVGAWFMYQELNK